MRVHDVGSTYNRISAINGAYIECDTCELDIKNIVFDEFICDKGCLIYATE